MVDGNWQLTNNAGARIAPGARTAAIIAGVVTAAAAVTLAVRQNQPMLLLGLIPAATIAGAVLAFGLRRWPMWSRAVAGILTLSSSALFLAAIATSWLGNDFSGLDPVIAMGAALGSSVGAGLLFLAGGWVYRDAQRRGLNAGEWATVSILVFPYLIGLIAYLAAVVLRDQKVATCGGCGARLPQGAAYCVRCGRQAASACPGCRAPALTGAAFCARCGGALAR